MKNQVEKIILMAGIMIFGLSVKLYSQCATCVGTEYLSSIGEGNQVLGTCTDGATAIGYQSQVGAKTSVAIGYQSSSNANYSTAIGYQSSANASFSTAMGTLCTANGTHSVAIGLRATSYVEKSYTFGRNVRGNASNSITIGCSENDYELVNDKLNSLMIGFNSIKPTLFVGPSPTVVGYNATGNVGIATSDPRQPLHVNGNILLTSVNSSLLFADEAPATTNTNPFWGKWGIEYYAGGLNFWTPYQWEDSDSKVTDPKEGDDLNFKLFLADNGNVGVGTGTPLAKFHVSGTAYVEGKMLIGKFDEVPVVGTTTHSLFVGGGITTEEVIIKLQDDWPDYVFTPGYQLPTLDELQQYIADNGRLPGLPSAASVKTDGVELGEMNARLLQKVEELTLYILQQEERIKKLEEEISCH